MTYSDEKHVQECYVLHGAKGAGDEAQDEHGGGPVSSEMWGNAREIYWEIGTGTYCVSKDGKEMSDDATRGWCTYKG